MLWDLHPLPIKSKRKVILPLHVLGFFLFFFPPFVLSVVGVSDAFEMSLLGSDVGWVSPPCSWVKTSVQLTLDTGLGRNPPMLLQVGLQQYWRRNSVHFIRLMFVSVCMWRRLRWRTAAGIYSRFQAAIIQKAPLLPSPPSTSQCRKKKIQLQVFSVSMVTRVSPFLVLPYCSLIKHRAALSVQGKAVFVNK